MDKKIFVLLLMFFLDCIYSKENLLTNYANFLYSKKEYSLAKSKYEDAKEIEKGLSLDTKIKECEQKIITEKYGAKKNKKDEKIVKVKKSSKKSKKKTKKRKKIKISKKKYYKIMKFLDPYKHMFVGKDLSLKEKVKIVKLLKKGILYSASNEYEKAKKYFEAILKIDNRSVTALNNLGMMFNTWGKYNQAIVYFNDALLLDKNNLETKKNLAKTYYLMKKYEKAFNILKDIDFSKTIKDKEIFSDLGKYAILSKNYQKGIDILEKVYKKDKNSAKVIDALAKGYYEIKNYEKALYYYDKLYKFKAYRAIAVFGKVKTLYNLQKYDELFKFLESINKKYIDSKIDIYRAKSYFNLSKFNESLKILDKLILLNKKNSDIYDLYIKQSLQIEKLDNLEEKLKQYIEINKDSDKPYYYYGVYLNKKGKFKEAEKQLKIALYNNDRNYDAMYELAKTYKVRDLKDKVIPIYQQIKDENPNFKKIDEINKFLNEN